MRGIRVLSFGVVVSVVLGVLGAASPPTAQAAWVDTVTGQFKVGTQLRSIVPTATSFGDPTCNSQGSAKGGTSLALVQGRKVPGVNAVLTPLVLVVSCFTSDTTLGAKLNFIDPADGKVVQQIKTSTVPSTGYPHFVYRPDKGDLLGCGENGALYKIDFANATGNPLTATTTPLTLPPFPLGSTPSCAGLAWDAEADMIYLGLQGSTANKIGRVIRFKEGSTVLGVGNDFASLPCTANGMAIAGGVLFMSCVPNSNLPSTLTILRVDKGSGVSLGVHGTLTATGVTTLNQEPGLGDLSCDPVTFHKDTNGNDLYTDALWSRHGTDGNGVVALEFPAFTCGLPSGSVTVQSLVPYSPLAAGLSAPSGLIPGALPRSGCFDSSGLVIDADGDGLPDCWEDASLWPDVKRGIDFDGDGVRDVELCVPVDINGDGVTEPTTECAELGRKDLFVYIDYMQFHKPDPQTLSQTLSPETLVNNVPVGVKSVREAFRAAPVGTNGIGLHLQVADQPVKFFPFVGSSEVSHVNLIALTPCTAPASAATDPTQVVDFDVVKAANFGTVAERTDPKALNAKRLAFRYVLFAHNLVATTGGGLNNSGCAELGGDDAVVTLGSFGGSVAGHTGGVGTIDQQAGTFMHEFGHLLGLEHGGHDRVNCKPNYRSVMSYGRQFAGSPILNRRLDYSPAQDITLNESSLNERTGLGGAGGAEPPAFPSADQVAFGPSAWSTATATGAVVSNACPLGGCINWNRSKQGPNPSYESTPVSADLNLGPIGSGCDGSGTILEGHDDWSNILYRSSAALDFAGGARSDSPVEMTSNQEQAFFAAKDADGNGIGDATDCGSFTCTHRIDIKPSFPIPKTLNLGQEANVTIAIFSEMNGSQVWNVSTQILLNNLANFPLTFSVGSVVAGVKVNNSGGGTCSISDVEDPSGQKDGIKDIKCQFPTTGLPTGTHFGVVSGFFTVDPSNPNSEIRAFSARQEVTLLP